MTTMTLVAGAPPRDRLEWTAVAGLLGFVAALQLSIAAAGICLARHARLLGRHAGPGPGAMGSAALLLAPAGVRGVDAGVGGLLTGSPHELHRLEATRPVPAGAGRLQVGAGEPRADGLQRHHHRRRRERDSRHRAVRDVQLRPSRPATAGHARALHDLFGPAGAGDLRGGGAAALRRHGTGRGRPSSCRHSPSPSRSRSRAARGWAWCWPSRCCSSSRMSGCS